MQSGHTYGQSLCKLQSTPSPSRWVWEKCLGFHTGYPIAASYQKLWNVDVISVVLGIANVTSPNYFTLLFATAQAIGSCTFKKGIAACV